MIVVTGGAGFIGSALVRALNQRGRSDILVVDDLREGVKFRNLADCALTDYLDKDRFLTALEDGRIDPSAIAAIFHQGACSTTTEWDGRFMLENNYEYSRRLLMWCRSRGVPFIYASSASVYGGGSLFAEDPAHESPLNVYGYSKLLFDQVVRNSALDGVSQVVGLRYFNVYGPGEGHKGSMASVAFHLRNQLVDSGHIRLFEGCDGYADGEQRRDFVYVDDVVAVNLWFLDHPEVSGIFNVGTGRSQTFNDVANAVLRHYDHGVLEYIPFPEYLKGCYQSFTEADLTRLRSAGCGVRFHAVEEAVPAYMTWLDGRG